jgi:hypothetical protein
VPPGGFVLDKRLRNFEARAGTPAMRLIPLGVDINHFYPFRMPDDKSVALWVGKNKECLSLAT